MRYPTLTRNNDFRRAYAKGKSFAGYSLIVYVVKNRAGGTRIGITSSKKIGNAVQRNRARRVIRAAVDAVLPPQGVGRYDIVLVARACTAGQKSTQVAGVLHKLLKKAGLLNDSPAPTAPAAPQQAEAQGAAPTAHPSSHTSASASSPPPLPPERA